MKKLLGKSSWYKGRSKVDYYSVKKKNGSRKNVNEQVEQMEQKTVLYVEHIRNGKRRTRLREVIAARLAPLMGFSIEVVERAGGTLRSQFPQSSLWEEAPCGCPLCMT